MPIRTEERRPRSITRRMAVVRNDLEPGDPKAVLSVVYPQFRPLQNREAAEALEIFLGPGQRLYHTGGYLGNGKVIWLLARLPENITVAEKDVVEPYMLLTNSHDGTIAINFRLTTVRVVCQNTLALAMREDRSSHVFERAHKVGPLSLAAEAKDFYQFCSKAAADLGETFKKMHSVPFEDDQILPLLEKLLPLPRLPGNGSVPVSLQRQYGTRKQKIIETRNAVATVFANGSNNGLNIPPAEKTLWGALNAVTAFVDHIEKINGDRYAHILFGSGATSKQKAYELALARLPN